MIDDESMPAPYKRRAFFIEVELPMHPDSQPEDMAAWIDWHLADTFIPEDSADREMKDLHGDSGCKVYEIAN